MKYDTLLRQKAFQGDRKAAIKIVQETIKNEDWNMFNILAKMLKEEDNRGLSDLQKIEAGQITFDRSLDLRSSRVTELPDNLTVGGDLHLHDNPIKSLPKGLIVRGHLGIHNTEISEIPEDLIINSLRIGNAPITALPDNMNLKDNLNLLRSSIKALPKNLRVGGNLNIEGTDISEIPADLDVQGSLFINEKITSLPDNFTVGSLSLRADDRGRVGFTWINLEVLPDNLTVNSNLDLRLTDIKCLPNNLTVHGNLNIRSCGITELSSNLTVDGDIYLPTHEIPETPDNFVLGGKFIPIPSGILREK